jgi:hydroxymethylbilane synthase
MSPVLRIGARPSKLALAQAAIIKDLLTERLRGLAIDIVPIRTSGDKMQTASLAQVGGKGLFIRELERALKENRIDAAVHSMKDLPATLPQQFRLAAVPPREPANDLLLVRNGDGWGSLRAAARARLGTSSIRRRLQALRVCPGLEVLPLRGNVDTRLRRLRDGDLDGIILAAAGLKRLGLAPLYRDADHGTRDEISITELDVRQFVPSGGQGALAVEAYRDVPIGGSLEIENAFQALTDLPTLAEITAERAFLASIGASCVSPVGVNARVSGQRLALQALLFSADGGRSLSAEIEDDLPPPSRHQIEQAAIRLGDSLGRLMLERGAGELIGRE